MMVEPRVSAERMSELDDMTGAAAALPWLPDGSWYAGAAARSRRATVAPVRWRSPSAQQRASRPPARLLLPGGGDWPWWGWVLYALLVGPFLAAALIAAAILRLAISERRRVWAFEQRRAAIHYLAVVAALVVLGWTLVSGTLGRSLSPGIRGHTIAGRAAADQPGVVRLPDPADSRSRPPSAR